MSSNSVGERVVPKINSDLMRHLVDNNEIVGTSFVMRKLQSNLKRVNFAYELMEEKRLLPNLVVDKKSNGKSEEWRKKGNEMFKKMRSKDAHKYYTKSLVFAESAEKLSLAYANRSAVLFEKKLYSDCLKDIEMALENNYPDNLKEKIEARRAKAKKLLAEEFKIEFYTEIPKISKEEQNERILAAKNCIEMIFTEKLGRHIVATREIKPGEIIAIEQPFCQILVDQFYIHCHHCLKLCYSLIPCKNCTLTLFCSKTCKIEAHSTYHQYECPILRTIYSMDLDHRLIHLRLTIIVRKMHAEISDDDSIYKSNRYKEIHNLVGNTEKRNVEDLFNRAVHAAALYSLLKNYTTLFKADCPNYESKFKELLLLHMQIGACNFHEISENKESDNLLTKNNEPEIGAAAFSFLSMFNHSCAPNVVRNCYGKTVTLTAIDKIPKGGECFDNYGLHYAVMEKTQRKAKLLKQYYFDCACLACTNNYPLHQNLPVLKEWNCSVISPEEYRDLEKFDLKAAKIIFPKIKKQIYEMKEETKPNKHLSELNEMLKQCLFIFRTIKTPI